MALTRLDNLYSSKTGKYLYVSPDDFNATDELDNRGNSPLRPFKTIQRAFIEVARYSFLPAENGRSTPDRFDQFSIMLMPGDHYIDNRPGLRTLTSAGNDKQRYYNAKELITANRQEIIDRAFGQIVIDYDESAWGTDWVVPGDEVLPNGSPDPLRRGQSAYRLIQKNKEFIQARAVGQLTIDYTEGQTNGLFANDWVIPGDTALGIDTFNRRASAYRLILKNKTDIVNSSWEFMNSQYPEFTSVQTKCKRDIGYWVEHFALDVLFGGNKFTDIFTRTYFNEEGTAILQNAIDLTNANEKTATLLAMVHASNLSAGVITNRAHPSASQNVNVSLQPVANLSNVVDVSGWYYDPNITADPTKSNNYTVDSCSTIRTTIDNLFTILYDAIVAENTSTLDSLPESSYDVGIGTSKCYRDVGFYIDGISLDIVQGGGNRYTRKYIQNYFNAEGSGWVDDGLQGEELQSKIVFDQAVSLMKEAVSNQLGYKDFTLTHDPAGTGSGTDYDPNSCSGVKNTIDTLSALIETYFLQGTLDGFPEETTSDVGPGESKCKRDLGYLLDAIAADLPNGGNGSVINFVKAYFDKNGLQITDGLLGEEAQSVIAFNAAGKYIKQAITNQLYSKDLTILPGPARYSGYETNEPTVPNLPSGNSATCVDVQDAVDSLIGIVTTVFTEGNLDSLSQIQVTGDIPVFNFNRAIDEWQDNSILDLSNPDNVLYKFNAPDGGAIVPRGCSLIGYDLRRTIVRPLYVPDPIDGTQERTSIFNLTGGCYLWQFTIKDGDLSSNSPLFDNTAGVGKVYYQKGNNTALAIPEYSHHKITIMTYADTTDLQIYYDKVARAFSLFQPTIDDGDFEQLPQENRIVGPLSDTRSITNLRLTGQTASGQTIIRATTKTAHGYFTDQYVAVIDNGLDSRLNGTFKVTNVFELDPKQFEYIVDVTPQQLGLDINDTGYSIPDLNVSARVQAEIDSVESASPYVFNCSIRSTWGQCGMWADGSKATGFKSMVVAQYTGVSLQKDDRAFIRYDEFSNTWNQASLQDAFGTTAYHTKGDAYWKDDWRNFHIRASDDSFIQCVSVFAVGFFDHFLMESGGDMSITNSNSNFGNTSLHSIGYKGFAFNQDKGGYITSMVPVKAVDDTDFNKVSLKYYPLSNQATKDQGASQDKLYYSGDDVYSPFTKPATSIEGYRLGSKTDDFISLKLPKSGGGTDIYTETLYPTGFKRYTAALETLNPDSVNINNNAQDAANLIEANKAFIQSEAYKYIITRYPEIQSKESITIEKCERDIGYVVDAVIRDLRVGGNINTIKAAEGYFVGGTLSYIDGEFNESIEAYEYVRNLVIAAMRNFDILIRNPVVDQNSSIINVGDTSGLLVGMTVKQYEYTDTANGDPAATANFTNGRLRYEGIGDWVFPVDTGAVIAGDVYIRRIVDSERIEIGNSAPVLSTNNGILEATYGSAILPIGSTSSGAYFHFTFPFTSSQTDDPDTLVGGFTDINPVRDSEVLQDTTAWLGSDPDVYPECAGIATQITQNYFDQFFLILNNGLTPLGGTEVDAYNLLTGNKNFISEEAYARMLADPGINAAFVPTLGASNWKARIVSMVEAMAYNIKYGGTNRVYDEIIGYVTNPGQITGERTELVQLYVEARDIAIKVMRNFDIAGAGELEGSHGLTQFIDNRILGDASGQPGVYDYSNDCADIASQITVFTAYATQSIGTNADTGDVNGIPDTEPAFTVASRIEPQIDTVNLAARATLFNIDTGAATSNPHYFETGTPVRLVPRIRSGVDPNSVDKRVIRLPKGFDTNTIYYVIAPGRTTQPEDYSDGVTYPNTFTSQQTTKLMLATTKENAAAGIYMYSPETESVDYNVQIDLYQYVLDESYRLHQYLCNFESGQSNVIRTDVPHIFDIPGTADHVQEIFFRTFGDNSTLPELPNGDTVNPNTVYYARYVNEKSFSVHATAADAVAGTPTITFNTGTESVPIGQNFYVFANKRESPVKFDPTRNDSGKLPDLQETLTGQWYIQVKRDYNQGNTVPGDPTKNIIARMQEIGDSLKDSRSKNTFYERLEDDRSALDRIYRLRYVIPKHATGVRDPLNGFVLKQRTDSTRRLVPQRIVLKPISGESPNRAFFQVPYTTASGSGQQAQLGLTTSELAAAGVELSSFTYDPYKSDSVKIVTSDRTDSKVAFSIQSARTLSDSGYLELTVFDHTITDDAVRNEQFITVKISAPQGGSFRFNTSENNDLNKILWNGFASGSGYVQGYFSPDGTDEHYLILKELEENNEERETVEYNPIVSTTLFQSVLDADNDPVYDANGNQELIFATLLAKQDSIGSPNLSLAKSLKEDYLYSDKETNVFTMTPGDVIRDDATNEYEIISVEDVGELEDTFYIFDVEEIKRRIPNQQEGVYYLTCIKGNISPYPTGTGVGDNFKNFKFSQPISQLYPINYKNDPLWFQVRALYDATPNDTSYDNQILDPPATVCAADNFIHGLVTTNDYKYNTTKEVMLDLVKNPALSRYEYTTNSIKAQTGNAASGSEDRQIPIAGDSEFPTEQRLYLELRRPSIARSGNHTFEYLGFGPGNYSTGFPLRQEVVLEDIQDFYAQAKREDGGIVFYTGLNSNGDLYIGNKKINAITGEETFLEQAVLNESDDEDDDVGGLVTTFELPVVFEQEITVDGDALFNNPVTINVDSDEDNALTVISNVDTATGGDITLDSQNFTTSTIPSQGNIVLHKNEIYAGVYRFNPRGSTTLTGQNYSVRTHVNSQTTPTNATPNQDGVLGIQVSFGSFQGQAIDPLSGDILLKGAKVGRRGSLGWIFANDYENKNSNIEELEAATDVGLNAVRFFMATGSDTVSEGLVAGKIVRISGFGSPFANLNGIREIVSNTGSSFIVNSPFVVNAPATKFSLESVNGTNETATVELSNSKWREFGVLGAETLRTDTTTIGNYALGINTLARTNHADYQEGFTSDLAQPRATLDVVGIAWISGRELDLDDYSSDTLAANRTYRDRANAFLVGGDSGNPNDEATFRVATTAGFQGPHQNQTQGAVRAYDTGRVGINVTEGLMNHTLTVNGDMRLSGDALFEENLQLDGGALSSTAGSFALLSANVNTIDFIDQATTINIANSLTSSSSQVINIANNVGSQVVKLGQFTSSGELKVHTNPSATSSKIQIGTLGSPSSNDNVSVVRIGGAFSTQSNSLNTGSIYKIYNRFLEVDGELAFGMNSSLGTAVLRTQASTAEICTLGTSTIYFGSSASRMFIGAEGGFTTINNSLVVKSSTTLGGDVTLSGGLNSGRFEVTRGSFSTDTPAHAVGNIDNANIDLFSKVNISKFIDTSGSGYWGDTSSGDTVNIVDPNDPERYYLTFTTPTTTAIFAEGAYLLLDRSRLALFDPTSFTATIQAASANINASSVAWVNTDNVGLNYVRIETPGLTFADGTNYAQVISIVGNVLTLDRNIIGNTSLTSASFSGGESTQDVTTSPVGEEYSELVKIVELTNLNTVGSQPLRVMVERAHNQRDGSGAMITGASPTAPGQTGYVQSGYKFLRTDHPQGTLITRYDLAENVSFIDDSSLPIVSGVTPGILVDTGDFSGSVGVGDILRFTDVEMALITDVNATSPQRFVVTDGNDESPVEFFTVDSTTGATNIQGTLDITNTFTLNGSLTEGSQTLTINNGGGTNTFVVDSANGNLCMNGDLMTGGPDCDRLRVLAASGDTTIRGGDLEIQTDDPNNTKLLFQNTTGNLTLGGILNVQGVNRSVFDGQLSVNGGNFKVGTQDLAPRWEPNTPYNLNDQVYYGTYIYEANQDGISGDTPPTHVGIINGGDNFVVNGSNGFGFTWVGERTVTDRFEITSGGAMNFAGQTPFFTPSGARRWEFIPDGTVTQEVEPNINYFVNPSSDLTLLLPPASESTTGDMIRIVDVGGVLTYNISLRMRARTGEFVQGDNTNANIPNLQSEQYNGGELVVQTPHASFGLVYLGPNNSDGSPNSAGPTVQGWWLMEI